MRKVFVVNRFALVPSPSIPSLREGGRPARPPRAAYLNSKCALSNSLHHLRRSGKLCLSLPLAPLLAKAPCECDGRLRTQVACFANADSSLAQTPLATFVRNPVSDAAQIKSDHSSSQRKSSRQGRRQGTRPIRARRKRRRAPEVARSAGPTTTKASLRNGNALCSGQGNNS